MIQNVLLTFIEKLQKFEFELLNEYKRSGGEVGHE